MDGAWFLESVTVEGSRHMHPITSLPFRIGRDPGNDLSVESARGLSRFHAEFRAGPDGTLWLVDVGSTNGTYVNRQRIQGAQAVAEHDTLHFGNAEFRLVLDTATGFVRLDPPDSSRMQPLPAQDGARVASDVVEHEAAFRELLGGAGLTGAAQPIVEAGSGALFAYELLGRCDHPTLREPPGRLFEIARRLHLEARLSEAFRDHGVRQMARRRPGCTLFVNTHPEETFAPTFIEGLRALRALPGAPDLVVEVHETAVRRVAAMRRLAAQLAELDVRFAHDGFGFGEARINELGEVPPHFVKFAGNLLRGLDEAPDSRQRTVRSLVKLTLDLGCVPLAEGLETEAEAALCREMGFQLIQGFLTGRPLPLAKL